ncbi:hypothetical protein WKT22_00800 [Candidatus Lokiarchaeum ossiferum]
MHSHMCKLIKLPKIRYYYMGYKDLLNVFANPIRVQILLLLEDCEYSSSEITAKLGNISNSEISRHLKRLIDVELVERDPISRKYNLAHYGMLILQNFAPMNFLFRNSKYFTSHRISDLPFNITRDIFQLKNAEIIYGTGYFVHKMTDFLINGKTFSIMSDSPFPGDISKKKVDLIIPQNLQPEKEKYSKILPQPSLLCVKFMEKIPISVAFSDLGEGFLSFPSISDQKPDFGTTFYVTDKSGIDYLKKIWNYFWKNAFIPST